MTEIPTETLTLLIEVGESSIEDDSIESMLLPITEQSYINRLHGDTWQRAVQNLEINQLVCLVKGLTRAEKILNWAGGSVSAVIWTYWEVEKRDQGTAKKLADWILKRTDNPYAPFGHHNHGAKSLTEYHLFSRNHRDKMNKGLHKQKEDEKFAKERKAKRLIQHNYSLYLRNTKIRENFIKELSKKDFEEQLIQLAHDQKFSVEFYPTKLASKATDGFLSALDEEVQIALLEKLKGKHKGPWSKFKRRLLEIYRKNHGQRSTPWDRSPWF